MGEDQNCGTGLHPASELSIRWLASSRDGALLCVKCTDGRGKVCVARTEFWGAVGVRLVRGAWPGLNVLGRPDQRHFAFCGSVLQVRTLSAKALCVLVALAPIRKCTLSLTGTSGSQKNRGCRGCMRASVHLLSCEAVRASLPRITSYVRYRCRSMSLERFEAMPVLTSKSRCPHSATAKCGTQVLR